MGSGRGNQAIAEPSGRVGRLWTGGGNIDRAGSFWSCVEAGALHPEMFAGVAYLFASKELLDDLDGLNHALQTNRCVRPFATDNVLVECLTCTDPHPEASGEHGGKSSGSLSDDCRVVAV